MFNTVTVSENFYSNRIKVFVSKDTLKNTAMEVSGRQAQQSGESSVSGVT